MNFARGTRGISARMRDFADATGRTGDNENMWTSSIVASLHFVAIGLGLGSIYMRARCLKAVRLSPVPLNFENVFRCDNLWALAALLWLGTGLLRAFAGLEKGTAYYMQSSGFWLKMALFISVCLIEIIPAVTLLGWRKQIKSGELPRNLDVVTRRLFMFSHIEMTLVFLMIFIASAMARGLV